MRIQLRDVRKALIAVAVLTAMVAAVLATAAATKRLGTNIRKVLERTQVANCSEIESRTGDARPPVPPVDCADAAGGRHESDEPPREAPRRDGRLENAPEPGPQEGPFGSDVEEGPDDEQIADDRMDPRRVPVASEEPVDPQVGLVHRDTGEGQEAEHHEDRPVREDVGSPERVAARAPSLLGARGGRAGEQPSQPKSPRFLREEEVTGVGGGDQSEEPRGTEMPDDHTALRGQRIGQPFPPAFGGVDRRGRFSPCSPDSGEQGDGGEKEKGPVKDGHDELRLAVRGGGRAGWPGSLGPRRGGRCVSMPNLRSIRLARTPGRGALEMASWSATPPLTTSLAVSPGEADRNARTIGSPRGGRVAGSSSVVARLSSGPAHAVRNCGKDSRRFRREGRPSREIGWSSVPRRS